jgi:ubiquinone/menaquinone biosynthesis C-methylase UbiE
MLIDTAETVLDVGCGTGMVARAIARRRGFTGKITGIDLSPALVANARRLSEEEGIADRVDFRAGDTRSLDLATGTSDAVVAHTLLSHVDDPSAAIGEAARVVRSGGMVAIFDCDFASLTFSHPDPAQGKAYDEAVTHAIATSPRVIGQMPRLLKAAGLELVTSFAYVVADIGQADFWLSAIDSFRQLMPKGGGMTEQDADAWAEALRRDSEQGVFFGSANYYSYVAKRP